jgi:hypothetical protein
MGYREQLLALVSAFAAATGRSEARIANLAGRDSRFFQRMREGKTCHVDTLHRVIEWFRANWPAGAEWPLPPDDDADAVRHAAEQASQAGECATRAPFRHTVPEPA